MEIGFFSFNSSSGSSLVEKKDSDWIANYENIIEFAEKINKFKIPNLFLLPIARWKGSGDKNITGDAIETLTMAPLLLQKTNLNVYATIHTFSYLPEQVAYSAVFLNESFNNRFRINLVCGWKEDELKLFKINDWDYSKRYEKAQEWINRFKQTEKEYIKSKNNYNISPTLIMNAGFSEEGRKFAKKNVDNIFETIPSKILDPNYKYKPNDFPQLNDSYVCFTLFMGKSFELANSKYEKNLSLANQSAVNDYTEKMRKSDKIKGALYQLNEKFVKTGSGLPHLIADYQKIIDVMNILKDNGTKGVAISLVDFNDAYEILELLSRK